MAPIIAFGGSSQTGKTTVAKKLADHLRSKLLVFGDFVRQEAQKLGLEAPSRDQLQDLGQHMVEADVLRFCKEALRSAHFSCGERLVIDGIRHLQVLSAIRTLCPSQPVKLIYLHASMETRESRNVKREDLQRLDSHAVESQTSGEIKTAADLVVDASGDIEEVFDHILLWVRQQLPNCN